jgi:hypothetical protein
MSHFRGRSAQANYSIEAKDITGNFVATTMTRCYLRAALSLN